MIPAKATLTILLVAIWGLVPWPLVRWSAAFVALVLILAALWSYLLSRGIQSRFEASFLRTFSGRRVEVRTKIENRSFLPSGLLLVSDSAGGLEFWGETRKLTVIPPWARVRLAFTVRGRERGARALGPVVVTGSDPTGMFPFVHRGTPRSLIVYPPLRSLVKRWTGGLPSGPRPWEPVLVDDVSRFRSYRDFQPGDPVAGISAAAWAHRGHPQVRTFDRTVARPTAVVVDLRAARYPLRLRWALMEHAVETAASLVWDLLGQGETLWLTVFDDPSHGLASTLGPGRGWADGRLFLERLALAVSSKDAEPAAAWPSGVVLPPPPLRVLWVGPAGTELPRLRGYDVIEFAVEEGAHGVLSPS